MIVNTTIRCISLYKYVNILCRYHYQPCITHRFAHTFLSLRIHPIPFTFYIVCPSHLRRAGNGVNIKQNGG